MGQLLQRASPRRVWDDLLAYLDDRGLLQLLVILGVGLTFGGAWVVLGVIEQPEAGTPRPLAPAQAPAPVTERFPIPTPTLTPTPMGVYGIDAPENWDVDRVGSFTRLASPNGRVVITLEVGSPGSLPDASARLLDSLHDRQSNQELTGTAWEWIDGSRSLLVSGTAEMAGRPVRFLAITVRGRPSTYEITISVPIRSDPLRVLPRLERVVSSIEIPA